MNADLAITILFGGEVALAGVAGGIFAWHTARASKDLGGDEQLNGAQATVHPSRRRETATSATKPVTRPRQTMRSAVRVASSGPRDSAGRAAPLRSGVGTPSK
jgi:hypothetical protein